MHSIEFMRELGRSLYAQYVRDAALYRLIRRGGGKSTGSAAGKAAPAQRLLAAALIGLSPASGDAWKDPGIAEGGSMARGPEHRGGR